MADPDFSTFPLRKKGNQYQDFEKGQQIPHHWGRTLSEADGLLFSTQTLRFNPLYFNREYAQALGHPGPVMDPLLVLCTVVGLSVEDLSEAGGPFLGINQIEFHAPVYAQDTLTAHSEVVSMRESEKRPTMGIVTWRTEARNQRDEVVVSYERTNLVAKRREVDVVSTSHPFLTEERLEIQAQARRFAQEEVLPVANEFDPQQRDIPQELLKRMGELGYFGITISQEYGGMGKGVFEYALIAEELARAWMSVASIIARAQGMGTQVADPERRDELLRRSARGEWIGAAALSEPNVGSDLAGVECWAEREGDEYVITGEKRWCGNALGSHFIQLLARTEHPAPGEHRAKGIQSFILEKPPGEFPRGMTGEPIPKIGYHGITSYALHLDGVRVPASHRIGARTANQARKGAGGAFNATMQGLAVARIHTAARAIGLSRGSLEDALAYAQEREQFGKPIASFQALRFKLADMATEIEAARSLMYLVADQVDRGLPVEKEAAMVKLFATEMAERVTSAGLQVHGGNGYTTERAVERYWRDARLTTIFEGTSEIQRKIISDQLLRKPREE